MKLICIFGHKWNGCICTRCAEKRDAGHKWNGCICEVCGKKRDKEHRFLNFKAENGKCVGQCKCGKTQVLEHNESQTIPGKCVKACSRCGLEQSEWEAVHTWQHVPGTCTNRCTVCGKEEEIKWDQHEWQRVEGKCKEKCAVCGEVRDVQHTWKYVEGTCQEKCGICGKTQEKHNFMNGSCVRCGKLDPEAFMDECVEKLLDIFPTTPLDYEGHMRFDAEHRDEVRSIGIELNELDGMRAMRRVGMAFARRRPIHARKLETTWDGIGNWMG